MSLVDELERLAALHEKGVLTAEEFAQAKARLISHAPLGGAASGMQEALAPVSRLRRSRDDRWLGGICGGIAKRAEMESWVWRLIFAVLLLFWGTGLLLYILLWIFVPEEGDARDPS
ncbi:MAG: PspC domain-containing protein [Aquabacterium sp.]